MVKLIDSDSEIADKFRKAKTDPDALPDSWDALEQDPEAVLVDVRTAEERKFVGHVPGSLHVAWASGTSLNRNPRFVKEAHPW